MGNNSKSRKNINYNKGICPVAESLNKKSFMCLPVTSYDFSDADVKFITKQFQNIWNRYIYKDLNHKTENKKFN